MKFITLSFSNVCVQHVKEMKKDDDDDDEHIINAE